MENRVRRISGSLNSLEVLETAVRLCNLSLAAKELGISQPAVSHHIAALENRTKQALFIRKNNRIKPTRNAQKLADAIALGFDHIDQAWTDISPPRRKDEITIACTFGFADQWLMQRFSDLRNHMGSIQVHVITTDRMRDIDLTSVDVAIVWNPEDRPDQPSFPLIREEVFPICSPAFLVANPEVAEDISRLRPTAFLHYDVGNSGFLTWEGWFAKTDHKAPAMVPDFMFDTYPFLLQAVRRGEGVGLGWKGVVERSIAEGEVVRLSPTVASREVSYYVFHRPIVDSKDACIRLLDWLRSQSLLDTSLDGRNQG